MAKIDGPLHSDDARGKIAKSMVFMGWKGIKTVRQWLKPTNPKDPDQGNIRTIIGNLGRSVGKVKVDSAFDVQLKGLGVIPNQQSKQSYLVQYIKNTYIAGAGATMTGNYASILAEFTGHGGVSAFEDGADALTLTAFNSPYDTLDAWMKGLGLYLLAKAAIALGFTGTPYTKALASWTATQVDAMVADMTGA